MSCSVTIITRLMEVKQQYLLFRICPQYVKTGSVTIYLEMIKEKPVRLREAETTSHAPVPGSILDTDRCQPSIPRNFVSY